MISATVTIDNEAVLTIEVQGTNGITAGIPATIDTGFSGEIALARQWIEALALPYSDSAYVTLADGRTIDVEIYEGVVVWDGQERTVYIHCMEGDALIGMGLMKDFLLHLPVRVGNPFTLTPLP